MNACRQDEHDAGIVDFLAISSLPFDRHAERRTAGITVAANRYCILSVQGVRMNAFSNEVGAEARPRCLLGLFPGPTTHTGEKHNEEESYCAGRGGLLARDGARRLRLVVLDIRLFQWRQGHRHRLRFRTAEPARPGQHQRNRRRPSGRTAVRPPGELRQQGQREERSRPVHQAELRLQRIHHHP